jgi:hypothetical protein
MKNLLTVLIIVILNFSEGLSQQGVHSLGAGPAIGFPVSNQNFTYYYKNGMGGSLQANFGVTKLGSVTVHFIHLSIGAKQPPVSKTSLTFLKAGYRTRFLNSGFFVGADAGLAEYGSFKLANSNFVLGGTVGYSFKISKGSYIDLFPSYNQILGTLSNSMWLNANVLYRINLTKKDK